MVGSKPLLYRLFAHARHRTIVVAAALFALLSEKSPDVGALVLAEEVGVSC